ncbi:hypothetical protein [Bryobacter aggregatus]|uniref:hypothetical protein n=1 Tax=Bryobacter aggregatus TaxID=360054 RepID=UPI0012BACA5D|nr:hypothetical protein [Bryobacter aggregatus]
MKRRDWLLSTTALAVPLQAQTPELLEQARASMRANREALEKVKLPMAVEPAFVFKA